MKHASWLANGAAVALTAAGPAHGHHSTAIFDQSKEFLVEGTVIEFVQEMPHARLDVEAVGPDGVVHVYTLDFGNGDRFLYTYGLDENSFQPGDRISVTGAPSHFENDPRMLVSSMLLPAGRRRSLTDRNETDRIDLIRIGGCAGVPGRSMDTCASESAALLHPFRNEVQVRSHRNRFFFLQAIAMILKNLAHRISCP